MPDQRYLVSNFREILSIIEGLRVSRSPGRGMRHISVRPVVERGLRLSEVDLITNEKAGEFPILLEVDESIDVQLPAVQTKTIPLSSVKRVILRVENERDLILNRTFENASPEGLDFTLDERLFQGFGAPRFTKRDGGPARDGKGWYKADWVCGGLAATLAAIRLHPETRSQSATTFLNTSSGRTLLTILDQSSGKQGSVDELIDLLSNISGSGDLYGEDLLERSVSVLKKTDLDCAILSGFEKRMRGILSSDIVRKPDELTDKGDIVLRALSLLIQRPTTYEILEDRVGDNFPGLHVFLTAAMLSGVREGLARLPWMLKAHDVELIGTLGSLIEDDIDSPLRVSSFIQNRKTETETGSEAQSGSEYGASSGPEYERAETRSFEICKLSNKATVGRALTGLADKPSSWRIICDDNETLHLRISLAPANNATAIEAEAKKAILSWKKRAISITKARTKKVAEKKDSDVLPGLLEQPE